jgi:hypothetical protein
MLIASKVFGFSLEDAEILRKVIGKKQIEKVAEWEVKIRNAAKERNLPIELADFYINLLTESASYSFNKCLSPSTVVENQFGDFKMMSECSVGDTVSFYDPDFNGVSFTEISDIIHGEAELYEVTLEDGSTIICSMEHKIMNQNLEMKKLHDILKCGESVICE